MSACTFPGCDLPGDWYPVLVMDEERALLETPICCGHKQVAKVHDVLPDDLWEQLKKHFDGQGRKLPPRGDISLDFKHIEMGYPN